MQFAYIIDPEISYYRKVLKGAAHYFRTHANLSLNITSVTSPEGFQAIDAARYAGLILATYMEKSPQIRHLRTPMISVSNTFMASTLPRVVSDDPAIGRVVARHLLDKGYHHFAFWGHQNTQFSEERWSGFHGAIVAARGPQHAPARFMGGPRASRRWLSRLPRPLGLMTAADDKGAQAIAACHSLGWRVPEDVAVVGVDDDDLYSDLSQPSLSSVAQRTERIGYEAAENLWRLARGETIPRVTLVPPGPLMARQSSRATAIADTVIAEAVQWLELHLARGVRIQKMCDALGVSRRSLEMHFKIALGRTPAQELSRLRIERAQLLLATTNEPLKNVAVLAGFGNPVQMSHVFRHATGQTPGGYRRGFNAVTRV